MIVKSHTNHVFSSNTYFLFSEKEQEVWVIDPGDTECILQRIAGCHLAGILLTHTHFDHIYGLNGLVEVYPDCKVYTSVSGKRGLYDAQLNLSCFQDAGEYVYRYGNVVVSKEGEIVTEIDQWDLKVLETPGHDESCLSYKIGKYLFTGDAFIPFVKVVTSFPRSNKEAARKSVDRILDCGPDMLLCPGHGECILRSKL